MLTQHLKSLKPFLAIQLFAFTMHSYFTLLPFYISDANGSSSQVGIAFAIYFLFYVLFCLKIKVKSSKVVKAELITCSLILIGPLLLPALNLVTQSVTKIYVSTAVLGILQAKSWPRLMAIISNNVDKDKLSRRLVWFNLSWSIPMLISPLFAGYIIEASKVVSVYFVSLMILLTTTTLVSIPMNTTAQVSETDNHKTLSRSGFRYLSISALLVVSLVVMLYKSHLANFMINGMSRSESDFGFVVTAVNLGSVVCFFSIGHWKAWQWQRKWLTTIQLIAVVATVVVFTKSYFMILLGGFCSGFAHGFMYSSHQFYCGLTISNRLKAMSIHEMIQSGAIIAGSLLAGLSGEIGLTTPYLITTIIAIIVIRYPKLVFSYWTNKTA